MKSEHVDKIKDLVMERDRLFSAINEYNEKAHQAKDDIKKVESKLEEFCIVITKEKLQSDKEAK